MQQLYRLFCLVISVSLFTLIFSCQSENIVNSKTLFENYPTYEGNDLGLTYTSEQLIFKVWSPVAEKMQLHFYENGVGGDPLKTLAMENDENGVWVTKTALELPGNYYTFQVMIDGVWRNEVPDPYVKAVGVNGKRGQIIDWNSTNPDGWENDTSPTLNNFNEIIIYELHTRDLTIHPSGGSSFPGKYAGLTELGTKTESGVSTGLDHIKEMGVTHVHLIPVYDHRSIDESRLDEPQYNWGYDPQNYNVPEGSYSSDPYNGAVRIREFKEMVKAFHDNGIRVILDVVYNHTGLTEESVFNQLVPGYYYRQNGKGGFSNASACGNETASERPMMRKFMMESMQYWAEEYHIDGFRVDLMGIHDITTMNAISARLHELDPTIFIYGEGWKAGDSPLPDEQLALKHQADQLHDIAVFSDDIRDAIKGHVFTADASAFISGKPGNEESIKFGVTAANAHPQLNYETVLYSDRPWSPKPSQTMTYMSCHDNHTLWDRLSLSQPNATHEERKAMHKLAGTIILTSQGVLFLHAGVELCRTKNGVENSFESPDSINQIIWDRKEEFADVVEYYKGLIAMRKAHPAFRMTTAEDIGKHIRFEEFSESLIVAFTIDGLSVGDSWEEIFVIYNGNKTEQTFTLPEGDWQVVLNEHKVNELGLEKLAGGQQTVMPMSGMILRKE